MMHFGSVFWSFQIYTDGGAIIKGQGFRVSKAVAATQTDLIILGRNGASSYWVARRMAASIIQVDICKWNFAYYSAHGVI